MYAKTMEKLGIRLNPVVIWPVFVLLASSCIGWAFSPYKGIATASYLCLLIGLIHRRSRNVHAGLMTAGMATDILLVLVLEFQRSAIATSTGGSLNLYQVAHVVISTMAVLAYVPTGILGYRRWKGTLSLEKFPLHLRFGITAFSLRTLGYVLMFSMSNSV